MRTLLVVILSLTVLGLMAPAAFAQRDARVGNILTPPWQLEPTETKLCFVNFCDTMTCGRDQANNISCLWDYTCTGSDNEEMLGTIETGKSVTVAGYLAGIDFTASWVINIHALLVDLYFWQGVGSTLPIQTATPITLNCAAPNGGRPSILESSGY